ncbi:hypothetical protein C8R45DRAFT_1039186 [Mycena sanguinolenta]|nr:hypothetical protein C8R45DRAFT_1039186 [Mycena sanguinolenta]
MLRVLLRTVLDYISLRFAERRDSTRRHRLDGKPARWSGTSFHRFRPPSELSSRLRTEPMPQTATLISCSIILPRSHAQDWATIDLFAEKILEKLRYAKDRRIIIIRQALPLFICGLNYNAQTDVCILDSNDILLLVQQDKRLDNGDDPEPQVIAEHSSATISPVSGNCTFLRWREW